MSIKEARPEDFILLAEWNEKLQFNNETYRKKIFTYNGKFYTQAIKNYPSGKNDAIYELCDFIRNSQRENALESSFNSPFHGHILAAHRMAQANFKKLVRHDQIPEQKFREIILSSRDEVQESLDMEAERFLVVDNELYWDERDQEIHIDNSGYGLLSLRFGYKSKNSYSLLDFEKAKSAALALAEETDKRGHYGFSVVEHIKTEFKNLDFKFHNTL
ncbi:hypothetical protein [Vibrio sp. D431a]|uniref:hypothetical protein n=1 Tax=Vibrio sp. D431a TaxID=2837388 RepID=UPI00255774F6|nr:hypothetical protein [Vibrio sp. D431a]MDK9789764.1 hypothetical protein [Vibrio sp. D431a]